MLIFETVQCSGSCFANPCKCLWQKCVSSTSFILILLLVKFHTIINTLCHSWRCIVANITETSIFQKSTVSVVTLPWKCVWLTCDMWLRRSGYANANFSPFIADNAKYFIAVGKGLPVENVLFTFVLFALLGYNDNCLLSLITIQKYWSHQMQTSGYIWRSFLSKNTWKYDIYQMYRLVMYYAIHTRK